MIEIQWYCIPAIIALLMIVVNIFILDEMFCGTPSQDLKNTIFRVVYWAIGIFYFFMLILWIVNNVKIV